MNESTELAVRILGTGEYQPIQSMDSAEFDRRWGKSTGWTERHCGVRTRRYAGPEETSSRMGAMAARAALDRAQLAVDDIDCVISACSVMEQAIPTNAVLIHRELGLQSSAIPAFDVNATCLSFLVALEVAATSIAVGRYRRVLLVSSEIASCGLDWDNTHTAPLFGDGAAAIILGRSDTGDSSALLATHFATYSEGAEFCQVRACGTRLRLADGITQWREGMAFEMNGRATYRLAAQHLPGFMNTLLTKANTSVDALRAIVPHQASGQALSHLERTLKLPQQKLIRILHTRGNQIAASIPNALHHALTQENIVRGDLLGLVGSGAGLSLGGIVLRY
jgi:3-oxoacyl-[acyl-carrier-protein] synthase-3